MGGSSADPDHRSALSTARCVAAGSVEIGAEALLNAVLDVDRQEAARSG